MMIRDAFLLALRAVRRNALRSSLTILGIVIGVAAVIVMVTLGGGVTQQVTREIASLGSNVLMVMPGQRMGPGVGAGTAPPFEVADAEAIARDTAWVAAVAPISSRGLTAIYANQNWSTTVTGTDNQFFVVRQWAVTSGREFTESELRAGHAVCILGDTVRENLFAAEEPLGRKIRLENLSCQVIGVLAAKGQSAFGQDQDDVILMPLRTLQRRVAGNQNVGQIQILVEEGISTENVQREIIALMRARRHIAGAKEDDFRVNDPKEIASMLTATTTTLTALLSAVAGVSLLVGGIGIMNIMLVSVTERTKEIGIRLAVGAMEGDVLMQFLVEAVALSSFGGLIGIAAALAASFGLARMLGVPFVVDPTIVVVAFLFSGAVGLVFGYFPARRAARFDPIKALRHE